MKIIVCISLLVAGSVAFPSSKQIDGAEVHKKSGKFPKKFNKAIHGLQQKKDDATQSSYLHYDPSGALEALKPPSATSYIPQSPSKWNPPHQITSTSGIVMDSLVAPSPDTYSSYGGSMTESVKPPAVGKSAGESDAYFGYAEVQEGEGDILKAPSLSSYAETPAAAEGERSYLRPPTEEGKKTLPSSYMSYKKPGKSSYVLYVKAASDMLPIQPPS